MQKKKKKFYPIYKIFSKALTKYEHQLNDTCLVSCPDFHQMNNVIFYEKSNVNIMELISVYFLFIRESQYRTMIISGNSILSRQNKVRKGTK